MIKVLVTDGMDAEKKLELVDAGYGVIDEEVDAEELKKLIKDVDVAVIRSRTKITKEIIDEALETKQFKAVIRAGVGLDNIDVAYATDNGIKVFNTPNASSNAVAELALAEILSIPRFIHTSNIEMREGIWGKKAYKGEEIEGRTLGLVGYGRIAQSLAKKAKALGMNIIFFDPGVEEGEEGSVELEELLSSSDFISLHIPGGEANYHFIGKEEFEKMKEGVYFIDLARGGVVDEDALVDAIESGKVKAAALDVFEEEPVKNERVLKCKQISITPHIGAATKEAQKRIGQEVVDILKENFPQ
ncbi:MAG: 3-phosphoglycerate dehydrogenase [Gallicola sp.]|uniref:NAD(P)-dependent oxidoreductase n=1 Tax=Gallicola sp. Sow4_E12 TaxID=3438785 RepID=UPI0017DC780B|nr:3-phosphoglycerate dehydrogenase [Gallicola sp.]